MAHETAWRTFSLFQGVGPEYQVLELEDVPVEEEDLAKVRVLVGGPSRIILRTPTLYLDVTPSPGTTLRRNIPRDFQDLAYAIGGRGRLRHQGDRG